VIFGVLAAIIGIYFSSIYNLTSGPIFIIISVVIFIISLIIRGSRK